MKGAIHVLPRDQISVQIIIHLFQPHQADQMSDPQRMSSLLQTRIDEFGNTNHVTLPHECLQCSWALKEMGPLQSILALDTQRQDIFHHPMYLLHKDGRVFTS